MPAQRGAPPVTVQRCPPITRGSSADLPSNPLFWLTVSVLLYVAGVHAQPVLARLGWRIASSGSRRRPALLLAAEALYYLGLPYVALLRGAVLPRYLGVSDLDWVQDIGLGTALMVGGLAVASLAFRAARFREEDDETLPQKVDAATISQSAGRGQSSTYGEPLPCRSIGPSIARRSSSLWTTSTGDIRQPDSAGDRETPGASVRRRLRAGYGGFRHVSRLTVLAITTTISLFVRNLPLLIGFHWLAEMTLATVGYSPGRQTAPPLDSNQ